MKEAETGTDDNVVLGSDVISHTQSRIEVFPLTIEHAAGPGLPFPANSAIQSETARRAPLVLNEEAVIGVVEIAFRLVADCRSEARPAINSSIQVWLCEGGCLKAFEKDYTRMLPACGTSPARISNW